MLFDIMQKHRPFYLKPSNYAMASAVLIPYFKYWMLRAVANVVAFLIIFELLAIGYKKICRNK